MQTHGPAEIVAPNRYDSTVITLGGQRRPADRCSGAVTTTHGRPGLASALLATALLVAGCSTTKGPAVTESSSATTAASRSSSAPARSTGNTSGPHTVGDLLALTRTAIQAAGSVHLHVEEAQADGLDKVTVDADVRSGRRPAYSLTERVSTRSDEAVSVDGTVHFRGGQGPLTRQKWSDLPQRSYYQIAGTAPLDADGIMDVCRSLLLGSCGLSPTDLAHPVEQPSPGQFTVRYTPAQWLAKVPSPIRTDLATWAQAAQLTQMDALLTVDQHNRPVTLIFTAEPSSAGMTFEIGYSRWGGPLTIAAPRS